MAKRQKNRFGTVDQLKSGNFRARYRLKKGEQVTAGTFPAEELAWQRLEEIEVELRHDEHWDGRKSKTKFKDFMVVYMAHREKHVTPTEFTNNRSYLKVHLLPAFGHLQMGQIDEETVDLWFDTMPRAEIRRNVYAFLRRAMRFAQKWKYIRSSPCNVFEPSKGSDAGTGDSFGLGREDRGGFHGGLELDRGQPAESVLFSLPVVAALDPGHDRQPQVLPGRPSTLLVEDVLLQQRPERFHRGVVCR